MPLAVQLWLVLVYVFHTNSASSDILSYRGVPAPLHSSWPMYLS